MKITDISERWTLSQVNKQASIDLWDAIAPTFGQGELPNVDNDAFCKLLSDYDMFDNNATILDVGCGTGRYALALAKYCNKVVGVDLSSRMLDIARTRASEMDISNVDFICLDWHETDLEQLGYVKAFDLVFARMTPAIQSANTFMKLTDASRNWCVMSKPTKRTDFVSDELRKLIGMGEKHESSDNDILYAFELLWQGGMFPKLEYEKQQWNMQRCFDDACKIYINRLKTYRDITIDEEAKIKSYLQSIAVDGIVSEQTNSVITTMYWKI